MARSPTLNEVPLAEHPDHLSDAMRAELRRLKKSTLKAARAWAIKESFRLLWDYRSIPAARAFFHR